MIHLFNKIYVSSDNLIDINLDRIVISEKYGTPMKQSIDEVSYGVLLSYSNSLEELVGEGKQFDGWVDFFNVVNEFSNNSEKKFVIYCDDVSLMQLLGVWFQTILPNATKRSIKDLIKSLTFRYNAFYKGRFFQNNGNVDYTVHLDVSLFDDAYIEVEDTIQLPENIKSKVGVEYMLASYLYDGKSYKNQLKSSLKTLITKDLQKYLYELKEIFLVHMLTKRFTDTLQLNKEYTFSNFDEMLEEDSKFVKLFTNKDIWTYPFLSSPTSSMDRINLEAITPEDVELFKEFTILSGDTWGEEAVYRFVKSDISKLDFLGIYTNFNDELLNKIIDTECKFEHAAGSFFSIDLNTVNHYLITALLEGYDKKNTNFLKLYSLVK
jgi:hypothetical protein